MSGVWKYLHDVYSLGRGCIKRAPIVLGEAGDALARVRLLTRGFHAGAHTLQLAAKI